jgi:hypothetical protein
MSLLLALVFAFGTKWHGHSSQTETSGTNMTFEGWMIVYPPLTQPKSTD